MDMGKALVIMKVMPESPSVDLKAIEAEAARIIKEVAGTEAKIVEEPIAFGLKAIMLHFMIDESIPLDSIEDKIKVIKDVSSTDIVDFRRAFG